MSRHSLKSFGDVVPQRQISSPVNWDHLNDLNLRTIRETSPIQPGDVVPVESCGKALVIAIFRERNRFGDNVPKYRVRPICKNGQPAKLWRYVYPGQIIRGIEQL